jgi:Tfp pilus assembly protein PilW
MLMSAFEPIADERGTTLVELLVGLMIGMVVLSALTLVIVVTLHGSARVSARVEATQKGRIVVANIMEELHSACVAPKVAPIKVGSDGTTLVFIHAEGAEGDAVSPHPTLTKISLSEGVLTQYDYAYESGSTSADWVWSEAPTTERRLMSDVAPIAPSSSIFTYYTYGSGTLTPITSGTALEAAQAEAVVQVQVALSTAPTTTPVADSGADSSIKDSAALRLTPPSYTEGALSLPCQ